MSLASLAANIQGATAQLSGALGLNTSNNSPTYAVSSDGATVPREFQRLHWVKTDEPFNYVFGVEEVSAGSTLSIDRFVNQIVGSVFSNNEFTDFPLPISPQEITQTEKFAVTTEPTQGGVVVHHSGNKYKDLVISGTTGVHPFKRGDGVDSLTGVALGQPDQLPFRSGYEVFQHFRAWMKGYHESKKFPLKENLRMIFRNYKDWEFLYVEPLEFIMKRDASKPLLYNYQIKFKVLGHVPQPQPLLPFLADVTTGVLNKALDTLRNALDLSEIFREILGATVGRSIDEINNSMREVILATKVSAGQPLDFSDISKNIIEEKITNRDAQAILKQISEMIKTVGENPNAFTQVNKGDSAYLPPDPKATSDSLASAGDPKNTNANPKAELVKAFEFLNPKLKSQLDLSQLPENAQNALIEEQTEAATISRDEVEALRAQLEDVAAKYADAVGLGSDQYNTTFGLTSTSEGLSEQTDDSFSVLYAMNQGILGLDLLLSNDAFFDGNAAITNKATSDNGADTIGQGVFNFPDPGIGVREGIVPVGATLERIAESELNSAARWTELAELNSLKSPYIVDDTSEGFKVNYTIQSAGFNNPTLINALAIGNQYIIPSSPAPVDAWAGKEDFIAEYLGGGVSQPSSWRFIFPEAGTVSLVVDQDGYLQYTGTGWSTFDPDSLQADGVLRPGDVILLPTNVSPAPEVQVLGPRDNVFTNDLTEAEKSLSVDLKLNEDGDLDLLPSGDLNVATGSVNAAQAIVLKLLYSKGSYPNYPSLGAELKPGRKTPTVAEVRSRILTNLLQDTRIEDVSQINILQQGNTLTASFQVFFKTIQTPVPITIPVG